METSTIILITGATSGLGLATAKILAQYSSTYHVILTARTLAKAQAAVSTLALPNLTPLELDVTSPRSISLAAEHVSTTFGRLDVLTNNAALGGLHSPSLYEEYTEVLATNVTGPALVSDAFRPLLLAAKRPISIYVSSGQRTIPRNALTQAAGGGRQGPPAGVRMGGGAYQVSKAALNMMAVMEHREWGPRGLRVFVFSPGAVKSNLRGTSEEEVNAWGMAEDPEGPAEGILRVVKGERDADVGCLVHKDGVFPW